MLKAEALIRALMITVNGDFNPQQYHIVNVNETPSTPNSFSRGKKGRNSKSLRLWERDLG
jgi:hypothetical protein